MLTGPGADLHFACFFSLVYFYNCNLNNYWIFLFAAFAIIFLPFSNKNLVILFFTLILLQLQFALIIIVAL